MITLNVIGCGRVGTTLAALLQREGLCQVQHFYSKTEASAHEATRFVGAGTVVNRLADMHPAHVWMLSVPDSQVVPVAQALADVSTLHPQPPTVFHCSGFLSADSLSALQSLGWHAASAHPVLNFANPAQCMDQFQGVPCGLEGDERAINVLQGLLSGIGGQCFLVSSGAKPLYHAAAVFSSNFMAVLQALALEAWQESGVPESLIPSIHQSLLQGSVQNLLTLGPAKAITGPAARGDTLVVNAQAGVVTQWRPEAGEIYRQMSVLARRLATTGSTAGPE